MSYATLQKQMQESILENRTEAAEHFVRARGALSAAQQMAIYANGYRIRLRKVLEADYPATMHALGKDAFTGQARNYIQKHPSLHFNIDRYSFTFADQLAAEMDDPFIHSLSQLERTVNEVFFLPDSEPLTPQTLSSLPPEAIFTRTFPLRNACMLLELPHACNAYLQQFREGAIPEKPTAVPEFIAVCRHENQIRRSVLEPAEYQLLKSLSQSVPLAEALEAITLPEDELAGNLQRWLGGWLKAGLFRSEI